MKVLYTDSFGDVMTDYWGKQKIDIDDFLDRIIQRMLADPLYLCRPYIKIKLLYQRRSLRIVIRFDEAKQVIIPLFITDKSDKLYGYNMMRNNNLQKIILHRMRLASDDIDHERVQIVTL